MKGAPSAPGARSAATSSSMEAEGDVGVDDKEEGEAEEEEEVGDRAVTRSLVG